MNKRIVVFAPHPDDETLGTGGTIVRKLNEGYEVVIVVLTDGRYAFSTVLGVNARAIQACAGLGVQPAHTGD